MRQQHTKEEVNAYYKGLRDIWSKNKKSADNDNDAKERFEAIVRETPNYELSYYSFYYTLQLMIQNGFDGNPYVDCKTYLGWQKSGFKVKRGEKSKIKGIVWREIMIKKSPDDEDGKFFLSPKVYSLFHRSQVEPIIK